MKNHNSRKQVIYEHERDGVQARPLEVSLSECNNDSTKMIKKFMKKVRKEETLKPFYGKLMYHSTKSQIRRAKKHKSIYEYKKRDEKDKD